MTVEVLPVQGLPEVREGDDLAAILVPRLRETGLRHGDVVAVTQKIVSKAEGRMVPAEDGVRTDWVERETQRVVARRGELVIAETRHGFVCANAGVDASNVDEGFVTLLPENPDGTADRLRTALASATGTSLGVVITDTFGRAWRHGVVNVAIGCSGLPALVDLRGTRDDRGRVLEATIVALADEVAAASGLVMRKAARIPAAIVRGVTREAPPSPASALVRGPQDDLFRESPLVSISSRRTIRSFGQGEVPRDSIEEAVRAACAAPSPHHTRPWLFVVLTSPAAKRALLGAMADAWARDLESDGTPPDATRRRLDRSDAVLGTAPALIVPSMRLRGAHPYPDEERRTAERDMFVLSAGAAVQNLLLALHAQGLASAWISSTLFCRQVTRDVLALDEEWIPMGIVAAGPPPATSIEPRPAVDIADHLRWDDPPRTRGLR